MEKPLEEKKKKNQDLFYVQFLTHGGVATVKVSFLSDIVFLNEINLNIPRCLC